MSIIAIKERLSGFAKKNTENTRGGHRCQNEGGHARRAHSDRGYREGLRSGLGSLCRRRPPLLRNRARKDGGVFLFRLPLSHGHLLGHDDASAERRRALGSFALACRTCMPICLFAAVFATTTKIGDLTAALYGMRLPKAVVVPLVIAVRFFPTLKEESSAVADAMRVRGLALSLKNLVSKPALMFESAVVPVMLRCAKIARASSLLRRLRAASTGLEGRPPTTRPGSDGSISCLSRSLPPAACFLWLLRPTRGSEGCCDEKRRRAQKRLLHLCGVRCPGGRRRELCRRAGRMHRSLRGIWLRKDHRDPDRQRAGGRVL